MTLGDQLRKIRTRCGYTHEDLGHLAGMHPHAIRLYEYGYRQPNVDNLRKLCNALGVTLAAFHHCDPFTPRYHRSMLPTNPIPTPSV